MSNHNSGDAYSPTPKRQPSNFDLFRLSASRIEVGACPNTIRSYINKGLPSYRTGKMVWVSRTELADFIRSSAAASR